MPDKNGQDASPVPSRGERSLPWVLTATILLLLLWLIPHLETMGLAVSPAARLTLETQIRDTMAKLLWAAITAVGAVLVWRHLTALTAVVAQSAQTLAAAERNSYFASQSAASDRYGRAMALLGDEKIEVRLGGVYSLERLARESDKDHGAVMEVLAAYVREHAAWHEGELTAPRTNADVQAIVTVLGRRHAAFDVPDFHVDLHGVSLVRAYLPWANLRSSFLYESNLEGALLQNADLRGSWLWKANLKDVSLDGAHLEGADLTGVAGLTKEQISTAHMDATTKLPEHLRSLRDITAESEPENDPEDLKLPSRA